MLLTQQTVSTMAHLDWIDLLGIVVAVATTGGAVIMLLTLWYKNVSPHGMHLIFKSLFLE